VDWAYKSYDSSAPPSSPWLDLTAYPSYMRILFGQGTDVLRRNPSDILRSLGSVRHFREEYSHTLGSRALSISLLVQMRLGRYLELRAGRRCSSPRRM
jgi:hypothetical protein